MASKAFKPPISFGTTASKFSRPVVFITAFMASVILHSSQQAPEYKHKSLYILVQSRYPFNVNAWSSLLPFLECFNSFKRVTYHKPCRKNNSIIGKRILPPNRKIRSTSQNLSKPLKAKGRSDMALHNYPPPRCQFHPKEIANQVLRDTTSRPRSVVGMPSSQCV
jgi:hypothetical protein